MPEAIVSATGGWQWTGCLTGCEESPVDRDEGPQALKRKSIFSGLAAQVELVPFHFSLFLVFFSSLLRLDLLPRPDADEARAPGRDTRIPPVIFGPVYYTVINFALANGKLPDIIWCSSAVGLTTEAKGLTFLCGSSISRHRLLRLLSVLSRARAWQNAGSRFCCGDEFWRAEVSAGS